jgi:phosphoesterase RecJ-like protein
MNYAESQQILEEIKKSGKILVNCHRSPDPDSIGSALALKNVLEEMGKEVTVICPSTDLYRNANYLKGFEEIIKGVDFRNFDFSKYNLFISPDSSSTDQITGIKGLNIDGIKLVLIDHHLTNEKFGDINLVDDKVTSVGEVLYSVFEDWGVTVSKDVADCLMAGIVGDTGAFRYPGAGKGTFHTVIELMKAGADKDRAIDELYRSEPFELIKFYGEALSRVQIDKEYRFVWSVVPYEIYEKLGKPSMAKESTASFFAQIVEDTDFGFIAVEQEKGKLAVSFRSRTGFNTSDIAVDLGGGGHVYASGASVSGMSLDEAVEKVLETCRKYAGKN